MKPSPFLARLGAILLGLSSAWSLHAEEALTPVRFDGSPVQGTRYAFGASQKFAIYSPGGGAIALEIELFPGQESEQIHLTLTKENGEAVSDQSFDSGKHELALAVPAAGVYYLNVESNQARWKINFPKETVAVLCLEAGKPMNHVGGLLRRYFYVPKGTQEIVLNAETRHATYRIHFFDSSGEAVANFDEQNPIEKIAVPPGSDGQVWSFNADWYAPTVFFFENLPNYIAGSKNSLLLPKAVVEADDLR